MFNGCLSLFFSILKTSFYWWTLAKKGILISRDFYQLHQTHSLCLFTSTFPSLFSLDSCKPRTNIHSLISICISFILISRLPITCLFNHYLSVLSYLSLSLQGISITIYLYLHYQRLFSSLRRFTRSLSKVLLMASLWSEDLSLCLI